MLRSLPIVLVLIGLVPQSNTVMAQSVCYAENDGPEFADGTCSSPFMNCIQFSPPRDLTVTGIHVFTGETSGVHEVSLWTVDTVTGEPGIKLSQGTWDSIDAVSWQGADLDDPVDLAAGESYFVGWHPSSFCSQTSISSLGPGQTYYWSSTGVAPWNGPWSDMMWKFRLLCDGAGGASFSRGDANDDGTFDISDAIYSLSALFVAGSPGPPCLDSSDSNDDGGFDISDAIYSLSALFVAGSPAPPAPVGCAGGDPTDDALDCAAFTSCP